MSREALTLVAVCFLMSGCATDGRGEDPFGSSPGEDGSDDDGDGDGDGPDAGDEDGSDGSDTGSGDPGDDTDTDGGTADGNTDSPADDCPGLSPNGPVAGQYSTYAAYERPGTTNDPNAYPLYPTVDSVFSYYNTERSKYYGDGIHVFSPSTLEWDEGLAAIARAYADELASQCALPSPIGSADGSFQDPFWAGADPSDGYLKAAGVEHIESMRNIALGSGERYLFYHVSNPGWRTGYLRMDGCMDCLTRIGIGIADLDERQRWVTFVWDE